MVAKISITTPDVQTPSGPYSLAVQAGNLVFISGQIARDADGNIVGRDAKTQARRAFANMKAVVEAAGGTMADIVKITVFLKSVADKAAVWEVRSEVFGDSKPASATVTVADLNHPDYLLEVDGIAVL